MMKVLTERENEVAELVGKGFNNKHIAKLMVLQTRTVEHHLLNIFSKLFMEDSSTFHLRVSLALAVREIREVREEALRLSNGERHILPRADGNRAGVSRRAGGIYFDSPTC